MATIIGDFSAVPYNNNSIMYFNFTFTNSNNNSFDQKVKNPLTNIPSSFRTLFVEFGNYLMQKFYYNTDGLAAEVYTIEKFHCILFRVKGEATSYHETTDMFHEGNKMETILGHLEV